LDYLFYSAQVGDDVYTHRFEMRNEDPAGGGSITRDTGSDTFNKDLHFAVTWDEETSSLKAYENGSEVLSMTSVGRMSQLHDVNVWLGRSNWPDQEMQGDFDEFRIYTNVLSAPEVLASYQSGPNSLAIAAPVSFTSQPSDQTIDEFGTAQFSIGAQGSPPISYQWFKGADPIPGATSTVLVLSHVPYSDNGTVYFARASNNIAGTPYVTDSSPATLTVNPDQTAPTIRQVRVAGPKSFEILFSEPVSAADAGNLNNYDFSSFTGSAALSTAVQGSDASRVVITAADPFICTYYTVSVSGIHDISTSANVIVPGSTGGFLYAVPSALKHRYTFNNAANANASGATVPDIIGGANATVRNLTGITSFTGNRITLSGGNSSVAPYVDLPNGLLSVNGAANGGSGEMTIEGWVKVTGGHTWSRIFDFGSTQGGEVNGPGGGGTGLDYLFYSAQVGDDLTHRQISIRDEDPGGGGGSSVDLPTSTFNQDTHFVVTWKESLGELHVYENGVQIGTYNSSTRMSDINDVNVWLGRSNWAPDQNLQGEFDEFRLYNQVLTPAQIGIDYAAGPDNNYGAPQSVILAVVSTNLLVNDFQPSQALISFGNVANVDLTKARCILFESSYPGVLDIDANGIITTLSTGTATVSANFNGIIGSQTINVVSLPLVLKHRYSFCDDLTSTKAHDTAGTAHGILHGGAAFSGFGTLTMNGVDGYVDLPNGIISSLSNATFETWITYNDNRSWARVFDFGSNDAEDTQNAGSNYVYFAARGPANFRFAAKPGNGGESPILFGTGPLATNEEVHVAITYNQMSGVARLYTNGVLIDSGLITVPLSTINDFNNWLGRSQFNDPNFAGSFNEFRIYEGAMTPAQVAASFAAGPDAAVSLPSLSIVQSGPNFIVSYPAGNCDFFLEGTTELGPNAQWLPVLAAGSQNGDRIEYSVAADTNTKFFRLSK